MRTSMLKKTVLCFVCLIFALLLFTACGSVEVTWLDADGTILYIEDVQRGGLLPEKALPSDSDEWHYTQWRKILVGEKSLTYIADRIANQKVTWLDADGTELKLQMIPVGESIPEQPLPHDTEKWHYTGWSETKDGNVYTYVAERELREDYFIGNVFQIIIKDLAGTPIGTGTGFVFNKSGWFITNAHVMEEAYDAVGVFEIRDPATGESFTTLEIKRASYVHYDKDIFIGKLEGYDNIVDHYRDISFQTQHSVGDVTYSVGYPNSSISLEIYKGEIKKDLSSLYDKLYSGVSYIASDSYIAPGSSGGILVNENAEVIGMTTLGWFDENNSFKLGAAIEVYNYSTLIKNVNSIDLQDVAFLLHPDEKTFIKFFRNFITWSGTEKIVDDDLVYYECVWEKENVNADGEAYTREEYLAVFADGLIVYGDDIYWDNGDHRQMEFYGYYSSKYELDTFEYSFKYTFGNGKWYSLECEDVNYSKNLDLTLRNHTNSSSYGFTLSTSDIEYAKEQFNYVYEWLYQRIGKFK